MAINKFIDKQGNTLLDLSADSVTSDNFVLAGKTYHGPDGLQHTGTLDPGPLDYSQYNFIDYDGTLLYSYTDEELDALTALPVPKDHTDENLEFQEWNWTLADLKAWDRTRSDRPLVGANYITIDRKSYLYLDTPLNGATLSFSKSGTLNSVDWGDGTVDTNTSHVYANPGQYTIVIDINPNGYWYISNSSSSSTTNAQYIKKIKLGLLKKFSNSNFYGCYNLESVTLPNNISEINYNAFNYCTSLKSVVIPKSVIKISGYAFGYCYSLEKVSLPNSITSFDGDNNFTNCKSLNNLVLPDSITSLSFGMFSSSVIKRIIIPKNVTTLPNSMFDSCDVFTYLNIPDSVTSIGSRFFSGSIPITLDLSKQTKLLTAGGSLYINASLSIILVPNSLLADYKAASYWSDYASIMVGV